MSMPEPRREGSFHIELRSFIKMYTLRIPSPIITGMKMDPTNSIIMCILSEPIHIIIQDLNS